MTRIVAILSALALASCSTLPAPTPTNAGRLKNACLPEAIEMQAGLEKAGIPASVLRIGWQGYPVGHAVTVYAHKGHVWAWDSYWASWRLDQPLNDPLALAREWTEHTTPERTVSSAFFLE